MPRKQKPEIVCLRCGKRQWHASRGLCERCLHRCERDGTLADYPRRTVALAEIVEEFQWRRPDGKLTNDGAASEVGRRFQEIAAEYGLKPKSAERAYYRAKQKGLLAA